jgi:hypothetical protein
LAASRSERIETVAGEMLDRHLAYQLEVARMRPSSDFPFGIGY